MVTTLNDILVNILGPYNPIITILSDGSESISIDWSYICTAVVFCIGLYSVFRIIGSLIKNV